MSTKYVQRLAEERDSLAAQVLSLAEKASNENRSLTDSENTAAANLRSKVESLDAEIRTWTGTSDAFAKFQQITAAGEEKREQERAAETTALSLGEQFIRSANYRQYGFHGHSGNWESRAAIVTGSDPGKAFMSPDRSYQITPPAFTTPLVSASNQVAVSSGVVEYASYGAAPAAAEVAEGAAKPEAALTATTVTKTLTTKAHHAIVSRQALEDSAQLRSWIDGSLRRGVDRKIEQDAGAALVAATLPPATGTDLLTAIRNAVGVVQAAGYIPNAVVLNPADWAALDGVVLGSTLNGPVINQQFWGLTPVPSAAVAAGTAFVGDFTEGGTLFYRNQTSVYISDSHGDLFLKNQFVVLAERRALYAVTVAEALSKATVTP